MSQNGRAQTARVVVGMYVDAVRHGFGHELDYGILVKYYGKPEGPWDKGAGSVCVGSRKLAKIGNPSIKDISTSYVERQNLTMRMSMRRFTRSTNGHSKKVENHTHAVALHFTYYNLCRKHLSLGETPAMAAGVTSRQWTVPDLLSFL